MSGSDDLNERLSRLRTALTDKAKIDRAGIERLLESWERVKRDVVDVFEAFKAHLDKVEEIHIRKLDNSVEMSFPDRPRSPTLKYSIDLVNLCFVEEGGTPFTSKNLPREAIEVRTEEFVKRELGI